MSCNTLDELLDVEYGKPGTPEREEFDKEAQAFLSGRNSERRTVESGSHPATTCGKNRYKENIYLAP